MLLCLRPFRFEDWEFSVHLDYSEFIMEVLGHKESWSPSAHHICRLKSRLCLSLHGGAWRRSNAPQMAYRAYRFLSYQQAMGEL